MVGFREVERPGIFRNLTEFALRRDVLNRRELGEPHGQVSTQPMVQVESLRKDYGSHRAVVGISFSVSRGEVVGFLGPNGAGKSTTMKMLTGYLKPTAGTAMVGGLDVTAHRLEAQRLIGYLPESAPLYDDMMVSSS